MSPEGAISWLTAWLLTYAIQSTGFLLAAVAILRWCRPRSPMLRERILKLGVLGGLLSAGLQLGGGHEPWLGRVPLESRAERLAGGSSSEPAHERRPLQLDTKVPIMIGEPAAPATGHSLRVYPARTNEGTRRLILPDPASRVLGHQDRRTELLEHATLAGTREHAPAREGTAVAGEKLHSRALALLGGLSRRAGASWREILIGLWAAGASFLLLRGLCARLRLHLCLRGRERVLEGPLLDALEKLRERAGLRTHVRLSVSDRVRTALAFGLLHAEICLPRRVVTDLSSAELRSMMAHELAHSMRRDPRWLAILHLIESLLFFQPLNRIARRRVQETAELICDDLAVRWSGERLALASCLTEVAQWLLRRPAAGLPVAGMAPSRSSLGRRIERLLDERICPTPERRHRWFTAVALLAPVFVALSLPGMGAPRHESQVAPSAAPVPESAPTTRTAPAAELHSSLEELDSELRLLDHEVGELRAELEERQLIERFGTELESIEQRLRELNARGQRVNQLLPRLLAGSSHEQGAAGSPTSIRFPRKEGKR